MSGIIGQAGNKSGIIGLEGLIGATCTMYVTSGVNDISGTTFLTGYTQFHNDNVALYTQGSTSTNGVTISREGMYLYQTSVYATSPNSSETHLLIHLSKDGGSILDYTHVINSVSSTDSPWNQYGKTGVMKLATGAYGLRVLLGASNIDMQGGNIGNSSVSLTYLSP